MTGWIHFLHLITLWLHIICAIGLYDLQNINLQEQSAPPTPGTDFGIFRYLLMPQIQFVTPCNALLKATQIFHTEKFLCEMYNKIKSFSRRAPAISGQNIIAISSSWVNFIFTTKHFWGCSFFSFKCLLAYSLPPPWTNYPHDILPPKPRAPHLIIYPP